MSNEKSETIYVTPSLHWSLVGGFSTQRESLIIEEPLVVEISFDRHGHKIQRVVGVTMRTPGNDEELVLGLLYAEGIIQSITDVRSSAAAEREEKSEEVTIWKVELARAPDADLERRKRGFTASSACGLCGRVSLKGLPLRPAPGRPDDKRLLASLIAVLPEKLRRRQSSFFLTGGCHGAAICDSDGRVVVVVVVVVVREDVGRHNAVDKAIGAALLQGVRLGKQILVLSGRVSFELVQKASMAQIGTIVAVGAPSSYAVTLAHTVGITVIGFARDGRFNVYSHLGRVDFRLDRHDNSSEARDNNSDDQASIRSIEGAVP